MLLMKCVHDVMREVILTIALCIFVLERVDANQNKSDKFKLYTDRLETKLQARLFKDYKKDVHPTKQGNNSHSVNVVFDAQVIRILQVNERQQYIKVYLWVNQYWQNPRLSWNTNEYPGISSVHVSPEKVWVPDIVLYNSVDGNGQFSGGLSVYKHKVRIQSDGRHDWYNPVVFKSICELDVSYFPFDDQKCKLKFGSWAYDASRIQMKAPSATGPANTYYIQNGEWRLLSIATDENEKKYQCCENPFADVTVTIRIRRQAINYTLTLILPCALLSSLVVLGFILPPESGERIGLSITVLLAVTVFQQLTSQIMPPYDFPYLAQYYLATVMQTAISLVVTTLILNFYHRSYRKMPWLLRKIVLGVLGPLLFCRRTKKDSDLDCEDVEMDVIGQRKNMANGRRQSLPEVVVDWNDEVSLENGREEDSNSSDTSESSMFPNSMVKRKAVSHKMSCINHKTHRNKLIKLKPRKKNKDARAKSILRKSFHDTAFALLSQDTKKDIISYEQKRKQEIERKKRSKEWLKAARVLDRFFLVVFVIVSSATLLVIFLRAPRFAKH